MIRCVSLSSRLKVRCRKDSSMGWHSKGRKRSRFSLRGPAPQGCPRSTCVRIHRTSRTCQRWTWLRRRDRWWWRGSRPGTLRKCSPLRLQRSVFAFSTWKEQRPRQRRPRWSPSRTKHGMISRCQCCCPLQLAMALLRPERRTRQKVGCTLIFHSTCCHHQDPQMCNMPRRYRKRRLVPMSTRSFAQSLRAPFVSINCSYKIYCFKQTIYLCHFGTR